MPMVTEPALNIQRRPLSLFKRALGKVHRTSNLEQVATEVLDGTLASYTTQARDLYAAAVASGPKGSTIPEWVAYNGHKKSALAVTFGGEFNGRRRLDLLKEASGMVFTETDGEDPSLALKVLKDDPSVRLTYISSSGNGRHIVWEASPVPKTATEYRYAYAACVDRMTTLGIAANNDGNCCDVTHLAFLSDDPSALYRPVGDAVHWEMPQGEGGPKAKSGSKRRPAPTSKELQQALDFLAGIGAGQNDDYLVAVGYCLKAMGHPYREFDMWAEQAGCTCTDRQSRWDSFNAADVDYSAILGLAVNLGWRSRQQRKQRPAEPRTISGIQSVTPDEVADCLKDIKNRTSYAYQAGWWWGKTQSFGTWRFDVGSRLLEGHAETKGTGWWHYNGLFWAMADRGDPPTSLVGEIAGNRYGYAHMLLSASHEGVGEVFGSKWNARGRESDFWHGLRAAVEEPQPAPDLHHIGMPEGVVDLRTGLVIPHSPVHQVRAVTRGQFRPGWETEARKVLTGIFRKVFGPHILETYLQLAGLSLTGHAQTFRSLILATGDSGAGKGGALSALAWAFGGYSAAAGKEWLRDRPQDIDATTTGMLEREVRLITVHELGKGRPIQEDRVMTVSGDDSIGARHPHGKRIEGKLKAAIWSTAVDIPTGLSAWGGIARRLAVLPTLGIFGEEDKVAHFEENQDLADALITLAVLCSAAVYRPDYRAPEGDLNAKRSAIRQMDPLSAWIEDLPDETEGEIFEDVLKLAHNQLSDKITANFMGRSFSHSKKWEFVRTRVEGRQLRVLQRI